MTVLSATIAGIGFWYPGLPHWDAARAYAHGGALVEGAPRRPAPQLLAPNERRRAPETVAVALEVALAACEAAGRDPRTLPSVFASTYGDIAISDYMCATLASDPRALSPTRFHNSVHNAAAGYWTIGVGAMQPATAIGASQATFAEGLLEALTQLACGETAVLLVGYDAQAAGPLAQMVRSDALLGGALVLATDGRGPRLRVRVSTGADALHDDAPPGPLASLASANAMAPMLPLFDALAARTERLRLPAGDGRALELELAHA